MRQKLQHCFIISESKFVDLRSEGWRIGVILCLVINTGNLIRQFVSSFYTAPAFPLLRPNSEAKPRPSEEDRSQSYKSVLLGTAKPGA